MPAAKYNTIDPELLIDMTTQGMTRHAISQELGISESTLRRAITEIQEKQGLLLQYRELQTLQLTALQARILEAITPEKIEEAPLKDLIQSYKILKEKEYMLDGKPTELKGIVGYLMKIEEQEAALKTKLSSYCEDAEFQEIPPSPSPSDNNVDDWIPDL